MKITDLPIESIRSAPWNPNHQDEASQARLRKSIDRYGLVVPIVVRPIGADLYETIGGAHRLDVFRDAGIGPVPCVIVDLDDGESRLLAQALNRIVGEDDLGERAALLQDIRTTIPDEEIVALLPETYESLESLARLGEDDLASHLRAWQQAQAGRLRHFNAQLTGDQSTFVEGVLAEFLAGVSAGDEGNPNVRGLALVELCRAYRKLKGQRA